jgi:DNA invertase Pin-like site-specific DNA recombinase
MARIPRRASVPVEEGNAALYLRVSTERQADLNLSIPAQRRELERYCKAKGYAVVAEFKDAGLSGTTTARPALQALIAEAISGEARFDRVVVYDVSRWGRSDADGVMRRHLADAGIGFESVTENVAGEQGRLMADILSALAREMPRKLGRDVMRGQRESTRQGRYACGSTPPFGYRWIYDLDDRNRKRRRLEPDPIRSPIARELFKRYADGASIRSLTRWLDTQSLTPGQLEGRAPRGRTAGLWLGGTVLRILRNEAYLGRITFAKRSVRKKLDGGVIDRRMPRDHWEIFENAHPALIDIETWDRVQRRLASQVQFRPRPDQPVNVLGLLARCAACGGHAARELNSNGVPYYLCRGLRRFKLGDERCRGYMRYDLVERQVAEQLAAVLRPGTGDLYVLQHDGKGNVTAPDPLALERAVRAFNRHVADGPNLEAQPIRRMIADLEAQQSRLLDALALGDAAGPLMKRLSELEARLIRERRRLDELTRVLAVRLKPLNYADLATSARALADALTANDSERLRALLPKLVSRVLLDFTQRHRQDYFGAVAVQYVYDLANVSALGDDALREVARLSVVR